MQQRLGRNAADVQADAAERRVAFDQHRLHAEVGRAECRGVAARAGAEHQHVAFDIEVTGMLGRLGAGPPLSLGYRAPLSAWPELPPVTPVSKGVFRQRRFLVLLCSENEARAMAAP